MADRKQRLILEQADRKLKPFLSLVHHPPPPTGWLNTIRKALNISLAQAGKKAGMTAQGIKALEEREKSGSITLQSLQDFAQSLDMKLVYALVPREGSLEDMVDQKATEKAREIVNRTSFSMALEDQENSKDRIKQALEEKKNELKNEIPKFLWD